MRFRILCALSAAALSTVGLLAQAQATGPTVLDKVFSEEQARHGAEAYEKNCEHCHEGAEPDAPTPKGDAFMDGWREAPLSFLYTFIKTNMPGDKPGSLDEQTYLDILAYLLHETGYPAGSTELTAAKLETVMLVGRDGPKPLPANALVRVVGCLSSTGADAFSLATASAPARVRSADRTTPEEIALSTAAPAGTSSYRLRNAEDHKADTMKGQRVQAKGVLSVSGATSTINVLSLERAGAGCAQ